MKRLAEFLESELMLTDISVHLGKFKEYQDYLMEWNAKLNLISRKAIGIEEHIINSIFFLRKYNLESCKNICDIGTGGGFPGIPLSILFPEKEFTLVDSIAKKTTALSDICEKLKLKNAQVINSRAEDLNKNKSFDAVIAKAVASLNNLFSWTNELITDDGVLLFLKGGDISDEINELKSKSQNVEVNIFNFDFPDKYKLENKKLVTIKNI